ncbi:YraN family protein [Alloscardovia theropitheci]|uniref:UPF0102 protein EJ419_07800 n=1 Tax=Alloscardovia theropitheci TaxID=2496842 RepID=A0A4R0QMZ2_9BIFI|nr:YraN family protein [Alloscardovia theropitheci]TCD53542.1 YraN family protein [Alloscardovia theropitheci]
MNTSVIDQAHPQALHEKRDLGTFGEDYACDYLSTLGWTVLDRNWKCRFGEIDIVAIQPSTSISSAESNNASTVQDLSHEALEQQQILVFIEVKTRSSKDFGDPLESITVAKQMHMKKAAVMWLAQHHLSTPLIVRFDAIGIIAQNRSVLELTHVRRILS